MISLSTDLNSVCLGESEMVCHIPVHSKSENESRNEPCLASFWSKAQGRIRVSPNGTQTHSFLYKIESSVKIAEKKINVDGRRTAFYSIQNTIFCHHFCDLL